MYKCRASPYTFSEEDSVSISLNIVLASIIVIAVLAIYVPTIYIRKTDKVIKLLEKIETNTRK